MYTLKTQITDASVTAFLDAVEPESKRDDAYRILDIMRDASGQEPKMWGTAIIGFGQYHYKYASGHEGDMCLIGFSPRKANFSLYLISSGDDYADLLGQLGKHKMAKACLYINKLADIKEDVLITLVKSTYEKARAKYK
jgi:hypothetical protein